MEALCRKGSAMCRIYTIMNAAASEGEEEDEQEDLSTDAPIEVSLESIDNVWRDVLRFTDTNDTKVYISCYVLSLKPSAVIKILPLCPLNWTFDTHSDMACCFKKIVISFW